MCRSGFQNQRAYKLLKPYHRFFETKEDFRGAFDRDRDRIIHSLSFRNLEYKTQVFINSDGDYFRTRLTHSLEASQIARTVAKNLGLNESLAEAIALAHDLGHTPFGHIGGDTLDEELKNSGSKNGFEHNFQSFRVLTKLEKRYKGFDGLNLTFATLEGVLKHSAPYKKSFLPPYFDDIFALGYHPSFEAMIVDNADSIAYISADIDDALKYELVTLDELESSTLVSEIIKKIEKEEGIDRGDPLFRFRLSTHIITDLITDLIQTSSASREVFCSFEAPSCGVFDANEKPLIRFSEEMWGQIKELKAILLQKVYRHERIMRKMYFAKQCVKGLFLAFTAEPKIMPIGYCAMAERTNLNRAAADYISSMSDRSATELYRELY